MSHPKLNPTAATDFGAQQVKNIAKGTVSTDGVRLDQLSGATSVAASVTVSSIAGTGDYITTGTADDVQIQAAISAMVSQYGGGTIYIKPGTYNLAATVTVPSKIHIIGTARRGVLIKTNGVNTIAFSLYGTNGNNIFDSKLANMEIRGNNVLANTANILIDIQYADEWQLDNVFLRQGYDNVRIRDVTHGRITHCDIRQAQNYNININDTTGTVNKVWIQNCWISKAYLHNIEVVGSSNVTIHNNHIEDASVIGSNNDDGININLTTYTVNQLTISNNTFVNPGSSQRYAISLTTGAGTATLFINNNNISAQSTAAYQNTVAQYAVIFTEQFDNTTRIAEVTLSSAQILALDTVPITLVATPGSGKALIFVGATFYMPYNSVAYASVGAGDDINIRYTDGSGDIMGTLETTGFLDQTSNQLRFVTPITTNMTPVANVPLIASLGGNVTTGNSTVKVRIQYKVISQTW